MNDLSSLNRTDTRNSNFELLRIVAMFLIVLHHFSTHGVMDYINTANSTSLEITNYFWTLFMSIGGRVGVDIFILITGYFMILKSFKIKHAVKLYLTTLFYSILFLVIAVIFGEHYISGKFLNNSLFPIGKGHYWFISVYLGMYILIPFINMLLKSLNKYQYQFLLGFIFIFWSLLPTYCDINYAFSKLGWFIFMYCIGGYIRIYSIKVKNIYCCIITGIAVLLASLSFIHVLSKTNIHLFKGLLNENNLYVLCIACALFLIAQNLKIKNNKIINSIGLSTLGIYLIHENIFVRPFLWHNLLHVDKFINLKYFPLIELGICLIVFVLCIFADKILSFIYEPIVNKLSTILSNLLNKNKRIRSIQEN